LSFTQGIVSLSSRDVVFIASDLILYQSAKFYVGCQRDRSILNNVVKGAKRTMSIARAREILEGGLVSAVRRLTILSETAEKEETQLRASELIMAYTLGKPAAQTTNINVTVNSQAAQLEALRNLTGQVVPTIDHNPLETVGNLDQSPKEFINVAPVSTPSSDLSALTSAVSDAPATPPASPRAGSTL
jgi:hypothetical protein